MKQKAKSKEVKPEIGDLRLHGRTFRGTIISKKMQKTAQVEWERTCLIKKYERYEQRRSRIMAHIPDNISVKEGDKVVIKECRPISKTKHFIIIKNESQ